MPLSRLAIVVMAKYPTPGRVKTRLMGALTAEQAANVHAVFLRHGCARLARLNPAELIVCFDPPDKRDAMHALLDMPGLTLLEQCSGDLGARIAAASHTLFARHPRLLFLGVDSPDLPLAHLFKAAELTELAPVSLSPTIDGGYWSLGLGRGVEVRSLLQEIPWSSGEEAAATLRSAEVLGLTSVTGLAWDDVDHPPDLRRLLERLRRSDAAADRKLLSNLDHVLPANWIS
jgi:rSAM/selenodomain-associated transferase 1